MCSIRRALLASLAACQTANPDVIMFLIAGDDMTNALKQAVQFGLDKKVPLAGAHQEMHLFPGQLRVRLVNIRAGFALEGLMTNVAHHPDNCQPVLRFRRNARTA